MYLRLLLQKSSAKATSKTDKFHICSNLREKRRNKYGLSPTEHYVVHSYPQ